MKTGEGKTLVSTLPAYLNALTGKGVHVVTVNDYLARRDSQWMGQVFAKLGLSVGCIVHGVDDEERRAAYAAKTFFNFKTIIPCHYRTFPLLEQSAAVMKDNLPEVDVIEPEVMEPMTF